MKLNRIAFAGVSALSSSAVLAGALAIGSAVTSTAAFATDSHVYPGAMCQAMNGAHESQLQHPGSTFNQQSSRSGFVRVSCPIARDTVGGTNGIRAIINVSRSSLADANQPLVCRLSTLLKNANTFVTRSFTYSGSGQAEFVLQASPGVSGGPYHLSCDLPFRSSINSYYIEEL